MTNLAVGVTVVERPHKIAGIAHRAGNPELAFGEIMREWAAEEESAFAGGKYVRTGALKTSLTSTTGAGGAIREITPTGFKFGTDIWYARFQGTTGTGRHRPPSAILKLKPSEVVVAERTLIAYIMHGGRA